jgi:hypothetical protein
MTCRESFGNCKAKPSPDDEAKDWVRTVASLTPKPVGNPAFDILSTTWNCYTMLVGEAHADKKSNARPESRAQSGIAAGRRRRLHGDDRQPAIWLDAVRQSDRQKYHFGRSAIQVAFSIFIATETWLVPVEGWFVDRFGPRIVVACGAVLVAIAWAIDSVADSLRNSISPPPCPASGPARSTAPASAMRSNGFPIAADWRPA